MSSIILIEKQKKRFAAVYGRAKSDLSWSLLGTFTRHILDIVAPDFNDEDWIPEHLLTDGDYERFTDFKVVLADEMYLFPYEENVKPDDVNNEIRDECIYSRTFAFDLDGTIAEYNGWDKADGHRIGNPIPAIIKVIKDLRAKGERCVIFSARATVPEARSYIEAYCLEHIGEILPMQNTKTLDIVQIWDDRAISVQHNTGKWLDANAETGVADAWK